MRRSVGVGVLAAVFAVAPAGPSLARGDAKPRTFGPYRVVTDAHGTCGNVWAVATVRRTFSVSRQPDESYRLLLRDHGTFLTRAGRSPASCETQRGHGSTVAARRRGRLDGLIRGTVRGGAFDPRASCQADCGSTEVWLAAFFGRAARFSCLGSSRDCRFDYGYHAARGQALRYRNWYDEGAGAGRFLKERFRGDVASR